VVVTKPTEPFVSEFVETGDDYQSGTELPHSKGFRYLKLLQALEFVLCTLRLLVT
jgi:hypothetical protein